MKWNNASTGICQKVLYAGKWTIYGSRYSRMDQVKFLEDIWSDMIWRSRPCHFQFFKDCLPQILLGPFLNTLTQIFLQANSQIQKVGWLFIWLMSELNTRILLSYFLMNAWYKPTTSVVTKIEPDGIFRKCLILFIKSPEPRT